MNMKPFNHYFKGQGMHPSTCRIHVVDKDDIHYILFEDINDGTSVTNATEKLAEYTISLFEYEPKKCRFFETYAQYDYETFDEIKYDWVTSILYEYTVFEAKNPKWSPANWAKEIFSI